MDKWMSGWRIEGYERLNEWMDVCSAFLPHVCLSISSFELVFFRHTAKLMNRWVDKWMNCEWINDWMSKLMNRWLDEWTSEWANGWMNKKKKGWINKRIKWWMDVWNAFWMDGYLTSRFLFNLIWIQWIGDYIKITYF